MANRAILTAALVGRVATTKERFEEIATHLAVAARAALDADASIVAIAPVHCQITSREVAACTRTAIALSRAMRDAVPLAPLRVAIDAGYVIEIDSVPRGVPVEIAKKLLEHARDGSIVCTDAVAIESVTLPGVEVVALGRKPWDRARPKIPIYLLRERRPASSVDARDPVCGAAVDPMTAARVGVGEKRHHFCSARCVVSFLARQV